MCACMYSNMLHLPCCLSVHTYNYNKLMHNNVCDSEFNSPCQCTLMAFELFSVIYTAVKEIDDHYFDLMMFQDKWCEFHP